MQVVLSVESGGLAGRRVWLRENQRLSVGRTEWSDFSVRDSSLADVHFSLDITARNCRLYRATADALTLVNGEAVDERLLQGGDIVEAGKSRFRIELYEDDPVLAPAAMQMVSSVEPVAAPDSESAVAVPVLDIRKRQPVRLAGQAARLPQRPAAVAKAETVQLDGVDHDGETVTEDGSFLAVLRIESGCHAGRKVWLRDGELSRFGRTEVADVVLPGDDHMSGLHFAVRTTSKQCWIYDLNSLNGLFVNKQKVERAQLQSGDVVRAGRTEFRITLEGVPQPEQRREETDSDAGGGELVTSLRYLQSACRSGLVKYDGLPDGRTIVDVARLLDQRWPMHLIVNFHRAGLAEPAGLVASSNLLPAAPGTAGRSDSLLLLSRSDGLDLMQVLRDAGGNKAVVALFTDLPKDELVGRLKPSAASFSATGIIARQLADAPLVYLRQLLPEVNATLICHGVPPWTVFADPATAGDWQDLGFPVEPEVA